GYELHFSVERCCDGAGSLFVERLIDRREDVPVHQLSLDIFGQNVEFFREILHGQAFGQHHLAVFTLDFRLRLRPHKRRIEFLFRLPFISIRAVRPLLRRLRPSLFHRLRRRRLRSRPNPWAWPRRRSSSAAVLKARAGWMPLLTGPRAHRPLAWSLE